MLAKRSQSPHGRALKKARPGDKGEGEAESSINSGAKKRLLASEQQPNKRCEEESIYDHRMWIGTT